MQRRVINTLARNIELIQVEWTKKSRGRPKITLGEVVKNDMWIKDVIESMILGRIEWRKRIYVVDPDYLFIFG